MKWKILNQYVLKWQQDVVSFLYNESPAVNQPTYISMIGSLLYLIGTIIDIMHAVGIVGRFQEIQKNHIIRKLKYFSNIFKELKTLDYGILNIQNLLFMHIQMHTGQEMLMIERVVVEVHSIWVHC